MTKGSTVPWSYSLIRLLFRFVLKVFYGTIVIENEDLVPNNGIPCIVCANHSNSLTDALLLVTSVPSERRNMIRLTAKATQFGRKNFTSWLIESAGTIPIKRRKDYADEEVDNSDAMLKLKQALELGDAVCLFPEGLSRYHPAVAPLKTGVARLVSDVLTRNQSNPDFEIAVLPCSITYMHRQHFRSDVLVTFQPAMTFRTRENANLISPVDFSEIRLLTAQLHDRISSGTLDSPSWSLIRIAKLAARIYAPLGTQMRLGDYVRLTRAFLDVFKSLPVTSIGDDATGEAELTHQPDEIQRLCNDLKSYQDELASFGIKDDRIRHPLQRRTIVTRLTIRLIWSICLVIISLPGLVLWFPVFVTTFFAVHNFKKTGPIFDTWDEIAQYKLTYGLISGAVVWFSAVVFSRSMASITIVMVPALMWMTLRWMEDAVSAFRAFISLLQLLRVGKPALKGLNETRRNLHSRVMNLAVMTLGLPEDPESYFVHAGGNEKGRVIGKWNMNTRYFSLKRRRKRDWNETLRLYDQVDYPDDDLFD